MTEINIVMDDPTGDKLKLIKHRAEFSEKYCADKGWDISNLTIEQTLEVRAQPGWEEIPDDR